MFKEIGCYLSSWNEYLLFLQIFSKCCCFGRLHYHARWTCLNIWWTDFVRINYCYRIASANGRSSSLQLSQLWRLLMGIFSHRSIIITKGIGENAIVCPVPFLTHDAMSWQSLQLLSFQNYFAVQSGISTSIQVSSGYKMWRWPPTTRNG